MSDDSKSNEVKTIKTKNWMPLESNPELMNKYIRNLGVDGGFEFCDVFGVDPDLLTMVPQPVLAVLLLFPISKNSEEHKLEESKKDQEVSDNVYFTKQTVGNACGTVGLIHAISNNRDRVTLEKGKFFDKFLTETADMNADERAEALNNNKDIEVEHQALANAGSSDANSEFNANLHFNVFVCVDNTLYELDGRKNSAINHGKTTPDSLLLDAVTVVKEFMKRDPEEVRFNLSALAAKQFFD